jgi:hypothetical protein
LSFWFENIPSGNPDSSSPALIVDLALLDAVLLEESRPVKEMLEHILGSIL